MLCVRGTSAPLATVCRVNSREKNLVLFFKKLEEALNLHISRETRPPQMHTSYYIRLLFFYLSTFSRASLSLAASRRVSLWTTNTTRTTQEQNEREYESRERAPTRTQNLSRSCFDAPLSKGLGAPLHGGQRTGDAILRHATDAETVLAYPLTSSSLLCCRRRLQPAACRPWPCSSFPSWRTGQTCWPPPLV